MPIRKIIDLRGQGGLRPGEVEIEFSVVSDKGGCQLPMLFTGSKILFSAEVIEF